MMPPELTAAMEATASAVFNAATTTLLPQGYRRRHRYSSSIGWAATGWLGG